MEKFFQPTRSFHIYQNKDKYNTKTVDQKKNIILKQKQNTQKQQKQKEKPLSFDVEANSPLVEVDGGSPLDMVPAAVSPLHLDAFTDRDVVHERLFTNSHGGLNSSTTTH